MDINDLHDLRDGKTVRRRRTFNPFIHISHDTPLMRMLYNITRPAQDPGELKKPLVLAAKKKIAAATTRPGGSMVSYTKERRKF
jgi:hypothetical protein